MDNKYYIVKIDTYEGDDSYRHQSLASLYAIVLIKDGKAEIIDDGYHSYEDAYKTWGDKLNDTNQITMYKDTFEDYLKTKHAEDYIGTDDDMPDAYDHWLTYLDVDQLIQYADEAIALVKAGKRLDGLNF